VIVFIEACFPDAAPQVDISASNLAARAGHEVLWTPCCSLVRS
jgi:hypothetical protein